MERIILLILKRIFIVPYWYLQIFLCAKSRKMSNEKKYEIIRKIVMGVNQAGNVNITCRGLENLPDQNGYIMFPNHQGLFDVLAVIECNPTPFTVVIKEEAENNLFLKRIIQALKAQVIRRGDIRQSMKVIMQVTKEVKEGRNYLIFAEGTRSKKGNELLNFKGGSFKSAFNAKCPIVPVSVIDSYKVFDAHSIKKAEMEIHFLKPIEYEEYKDMKTTEIAEIVKNMIQKDILQKDI